MKHLFIAAALAASTCLSACAGFTPMHATPGGQATLSNLSLIIEEGDDEADREAGFLIRQRLADRISVENGDSAPYVLRITPRNRRVGLGLTTEDRATRFDSVIRARWRLEDAKTGDLIERGDATSTSTYSASRDPYQLSSTTAAANERAAREVADELLTSISLALAERAEQN